MPKTTTIKFARGQAARVKNSVDTNAAFARAYEAFVKTWKREPNWTKSDMRLQIKPESIVCEIQEK